MVIQFDQYCLALQYTVEKNLMIYHATILCHTFASGSSQVSFLTLSPEDASVASGLLIRDLNMHLDFCKAILQQGLL